MNRTIKLGRCSRRAQQTFTLDSFIVVANLKRVEEMFQGESYQVNQLTKKRAQNGRV